jgi:peptide/nickel transport system permease protein
MSPRIESSEPQEVKAHYDQEHLRLPTDMIAAPGELPHDQRSALETLTPGERSSAATLSQWQLIWLRFSRHWLALASLYVLIVLYGVAVFAEFFAPYGSGTKDVNMIYCPPQIPALTFRDGLHVGKLQREIDPITLRNYYVETAGTIPLGFFVRGEPYRLWGLIPLDRHFFGARAANGKTPASFFLFGADKYGRDVLSRLIYGSRISLSIGIVSIIVTFILGAAIGGVSGYLGGPVDNFIQRMIEVISSFPQLPLWLALAAVMPKDWSAINTYFAITIVLSLLGWTGLARVIRGKILSLREEDYAVAARLLGASHTRIIARHLLPGFTSHIIVSLSLSVPGMILGETALSFLGLGLRPPVVSWGVMLQDSMKIDVVANYPWLLMPVVLITITVLAFNFFGDGMRDAADPYSSR